MKIKLDENLGERGAALFRAAGHDVASVPQQQLCGASDRQLIDVCRSEGRCLVTLDLDFSNPIVFQPSGYCGIAVIRLPRYAMIAELFDACAVLIKGLEVAPVSGKLWIVDRERIREYQPDEPT